MDTPSLLLCIAPPSMSAGTRARIERPGRRPTFISPAWHAVMPRQVQLLVMRPSFQDILDILVFSALLETRSENLKQVELAIFGRKADC